MQARRRFRFIREIATGGFGKVYLAEMISSENFSTAVAVKLLHGRWLSNDEIVMRARDEARLLGKLRHKNIVRVEDLTSIHGQCAIVMEYLDGVDTRTLCQWLRDHNRPFPREAAFELGAGVAAALHAAFASRPLQGGEPLRVIHRDIKPSNVMVTAEGEVKVLDFGTARATFAEREASTQALAFGSTAYMSPERHLGDEDTAAADVFSLGVMLWEVLALEGFGRIQVRRERFEEVLDERVASLDFSGLGEGCAAEARSILRSLLAWDPAERPSAETARDQLERLAETARDGSLKRLAREVVRTIQSTTPPPADPHDPITGSTVTEDLRFSSPTEARLLEARAFDGAPPDDAPIPPAEPDDAPPIYLPPPPGQIPTPPPALTGVGQAPPPPPVPGRPPPPPVVTPEPEAPPADPFDEPTEPRRGEGRRWLVLAGAVAFLALSGVTVRYLAGRSTPPSPVVVTPVPDPADPPRSLPPGADAPDWTPPASGKGTALLEGPSGASAVSVVGPGGRLAEWNGSGWMRLADLDAGVYRTRVEVAGGPAARADFVVDAGRVCAWRYDVATARWSTGECR